ncbi:alpha/beta-hydrolase [Amniculicola lignicola CBS 123094]|uniref:Alpha/beta-hydrolase n=1 Tax=Amniculicola lignicola CBS 123094 TaxID=1392246 RepID=A0A6A5WQQ5_9PLEO|nr:alpha/beta-hydrolase [Amniculicola lignicola CBS 123094]
MATKPQIVLVPGAWHTPEAFSDIKGKLESHGYTIHARQLPSVGSNPPPEDLSQDITALRALITEAIGEGNEVLVVPHSWSGLITGSALSGYGIDKRAENGEKGGIRRLAFMCAFVVPEGVALLDTIQGKIPDWWEVRDGLTFVKDQTIFYNDLPAPEQKKWFDLLQSHAFATKKSKSTAAAWTEYPCSYLICENDLAIPSFAQEGMVGGMKEMGVDVQVQRMKSGHSPFLSRPDEVVEWIRRAAGEEI